MKSPERGSSWTLASSASALWLERGDLEKIAARLREVERDRHDDGRYARGVEPRGRYDDDPPRYPKKRGWTDLFEIFG